MTPPSTTLCRRAPATVKPNYLASRACTILKSASENSPSLLVSYGPLLAWQGLVLAGKCTENQFVLLQVGGISQEADYEYLGQDGFCHDRKHGGRANAGLTRLKVIGEYINS